MEAVKLKTIEESISQILEENGIKRGSSSWIDYEKAKDLVCRNLSPEQYERTIQAITDYLRV